METKEIKRLRCAHGYRNECAAFVFSGFHIYFKRFFAQLGYQLDNIFHILTHQRAMRGLHADRYLNHILREMLINLPDGRSLVTNVA